MHRRDARGGASTPPRDEKMMHRGDGRHFGVGVRYRRDARRVADVSYRASDSGDERQAAPSGEAAESAARRIRRSSWKRSVARRSNTALFTPRLGAAAGARFETSRSENAWALMVDDAAIRDLDDEMTRR